MHTASLGRRDRLISAYHSSPHLKSPQQARAFRRGLVVATTQLRSAHLAVPNDAVCFFSYEYPFEMAQFN